MQMDTNEKVVDEQQDESFDVSGQESVQVLDANQNKIKKLISKPDIKFQGIFHTEL